MSSVCQAAGGLEESLSYLGWGPLSNTQCKMEAGKHSKTSKGSKVERRFKRARNREVAITEKHLLPPGEAKELVAPMASCEPGRTKRVSVEKARETGTMNN